MKRKRVFENPLAIIFAHSMMLVRRTFSEMQSSILNSTELLRKMKDCLSQDARTIITTSSTTPKMTISKQSREEFDF